MEKKKLLLVFIHGFKGDDTTFLSFPTDLSAQLSLALPSLSIEAVVYPAFETRGDLASTVRRFTDWLTTIVIDMEVARGTTAPMAEPGVRVVIAGHSMGGLVGAECLLGLVSEMQGQPGGEQSTEAQQAAQDGEREVKMGKEDARRRWKTGSTANVGTNDTEMQMGLQMFPHIQGLLAFDTPYLGISPGVVAHGAEGHWNTGKAWYDSATGLFATVQGMRGLGKDGETAAKAGQQEREEPIENTKAAAKASAPSSSWSKYALYGLGASALGVAAGTTAYLARSTISSGYEWTTSHLQFVGCLGKPEELRSRFSAVVALSSPPGELATSPRNPFIGFANFYTLLGKGASPGARQQQSTPGFGAGPESNSKFPFNIPGLGGGQPQRNEWSENFLGSERTFCNVPKQGRAPMRIPQGSNKERPGPPDNHQPGPQDKPVWHAALNDLAPDEVSAHCAIFNPEQNLGYYSMADEARDLIVEWLKQGEWA